MCRPPGRTSMSKIVSVTPVSRTSTTSSHMQIAVDQPVEPGELVGACGAVRVRVAQPPQRRDPHRVAAAPPLDVVEVGTRACSRRRGWRCADPSRCVRGPRRGARRGAARSSAACARASVRRPGRSAHGRGRASTCRRDVRDGRRAPAGRRPGLRRSSRPTCACPRCCRPRRPDLRGTPRAAPSGQPNTIGGMRFSVALPPAPIHSSRLDANVEVHVTAFGSAVRREPEPVQHRLDAVEDRLVGVRHHELLAAPVPLGGVDTEEPCELAIDEQRARQTGARALGEDAVVAAHEVEQAVDLRGEVEREPRAARVVLGVPVAVVAEQSRERRRRRRTHRASSGRCRRGCGYSDSGMTSSRSMVVRANVGIGDPARHRDANARPQLRRCAPSAADRRGRG